MPSLATKRALEEKRPGESGQDESAEGVAGERCQFRGLMDYSGPAIIGPGAERKDMAKTWNKTVTFDATADQLFNVLTSGDFQVASQKNDPAVVSASYHEVSRSDERLVLVIDTLEYARGMTGLDKKKTEKNKTTWTFDLKRMRGKWVYSSASSWADKVQAEGADTVEAGSGGKARLVSEATFTVRIPLIGGKIEGFIMKEIEQSRPAFERTIREFLKKTD